MNPGQPVRPSRRGLIPAPDGASVGDRLECASPVADWLAFLAELLAAEFLREVNQGGDPE